MFENLKSMENNKPPGNDRPISLLNTDMKIINKVLSTRIKNALPFLIFSGQRAGIC